MAAIIFKIKKTQTQEDTSLLGEAAAGVSLPSV